MTIFSIIFSAPTFGTTPDISSSASSADCKHTPLNTYSGASNLTANWQANEIHLSWYVDGTSNAINVPIESQSCIYDGTLTPPPPPAREGYIFKGWRARQFDLTYGGLSSAFVGIGASKYVAVYATSNGGTSARSYNAASPLSYYPRPGEASGLQAGEWGVSFNYGDVVGKAVCSTLSGDNNKTWTNDPSNWRKSEQEVFQPAINSIEKNQCWCVLESFRPTGGQTIDLMSGGYLNVDISILKVIIPVIHAL